MEVGAKVCEKDLVKANLAAARKQLAETFPHLTDDLLKWAPTSQMHTIQRVLMDIITTEQVIVERLKGLPRRSDEELDAPLEAITTVSGMISSLRESRDETNAYIDTLDDSRLLATAKVSKEFAEELQLMEPPVAEVLRYIARHEAYHTGQIISYLWASGDDPYVW